MRYQQEYRDPAAARKLQHAIAEITTRPWSIMEVCGGQTHTIVRYGIDELLPEKIQLVHGPGCPVCVTPLELIDKAIEIASRDDVIFCSFGDMLRVPGSHRDLFDVKAAGGDVRVVYSPLDALKIADQNPNRTVVFFAVGFETTAPANAMAVWQAKRRHIDNFAVLVSHVLVPPAMEAILSSPTNRVQGFLGAGHVCSVMGYEEYEPLAEKYHLPIVVTGFEPIDLLEGIYRCVRMLEQGRVGVDNQYARAVRRGGSPSARGLMDDVFQVSDRKWRGIGVIPRSGYRLREEYQRFDAEHRFSVEQLQVRESETCLSGMILQGTRKPSECPAFGRECTPEHPLGATMVSSEGACAAYYHHGRFREATAMES
ncbi:hydrogenase formation protein HypD [Roseiconus nitratireducens]|uniref:Hydrogenase formation protein HypD n=1 Tax=Roseiconus nitratireducens TaxID=2605748 RepID=A0A5M6DBD7_9BACT|nr:hydrogenase formation protein HypD [Roseiconus nitratireducens]KAA5543710.1 hydrogenase formation protein HypD [Roseiconus nitratireducens]